MSFRIRTRRKFENKLRRWHLPAEVLIDVRLRLDDLGEGGAQLLRRVTHPFDGMVYTFLTADRSNRVYGYVFTFHVRFGDDEQTLWVVNAGYERFAV